MTERVVINGLKSRPDLNGQVAVLQKRLPNDRVEIRVADEVFSVKSDVAVPFSGVDAHFDSPNYSLWISKSWFYATGNTPARYLLQHIPPDLGVARVLLLGCGDPRNVLFTTWSDYSSGGLAAQRQLDFVCCDLEPSIHARNWMLFKLCLDRVDLAIIWCIFYSKKIDSKCMAVIQKAASELLLYGVDLDSWHQSEFGSRFRFVDHASFTAVRRIWAVYAQGIDADREAEILKDRKPEFAPLHKVYHPLLPQGVLPCITHALRTTVHTKDIIDNYRADGSCPKCIYSTSGPQTFLLNPLMLRGVEQKNDLHYLVDPTLGYHLSLLYVDTTTSSAKASPSVDDVYKHCFQQFSDWCGALQASVDKLTIRAIRGDALFVCYALAAKRTSGVEFIPRYGLAGMHIDSDTPTSFDVIESSNLADTCGLLNLLPACFMVMSDATHSYVSTELLATCAPDEKGAEAFLAQELRTDLATFALLTGFIPHIALQTSTNFFNSASVMEQNLSRTPTDAGRFRFDWRRSPLTSKIVISEQSYLQLMTELFRKWFEERLGSWNMAQLKENVIKRVSTMHGQNEYAAPTCQTYVRIIALSLQRLDGIGKDIGHTLTDWIAQVGLIMVSNYLQDFTCWLIRLGVMSALPLCKLPTERLLRALGAPKTIKIQKTFPLVRVTLWVPMSAMDKLRDYPAPDFEMTIQSPAFDNKFTSLHISNWPAASEKSHRIGISAVAPLWDMLDHADPRSITVIVNLNAGGKLRYPEAFKKLGMFAQFFTAPLTDQNQVSWAYHDHTLEVRPTSPMTPTANSSAEAVPRLIAELKNNRLSTLKCTLPIESSEKSLKMLPGNDICKVVVQSTSQPPITIAFPYPVDHRLVKISKGNNNKGTMLTYLPSRGDPVNVFALTLDTAVDSTRILPFCWSMPRVLLKSLPQLELPSNLKTSNLEWLRILPTLQFSRKEREERDSVDAFLGVRKLLSSLLTELITPPTQTNFRQRWFGVRTDVDDRSPPRIVFYINALRMDPTDFSVVMDVNVCILSEGNTKQVHEILESVGGLTMFRMSNEEQYAWLLNLVDTGRERARNNWQHQSRTCTLLATNTCTCGNGVDLDDTFEELPGISKVQNFFFRAALSPFFSMNTSAIPSQKDLASVRGSTSTTTTATSTQTSTSSTSSTSSTTSTSSTNSTSRTSSRSNATASASPPSELCLGCGQPAERLLRCGACQRAGYCGRECQRQHWRVHKKQCKDSGYVN